MRHRIRRAAPEDLKFIRDLHRANMGPHIARQFGSYDEAVQSAKFSNPDAIEDFDVIEIGGELVGCRHVHVFEDHIRLYRLWLLPHVQNEGIGSAMLESIIEEAQQRCLPVRLTVLKSNPAKQLYERHGFSTVAETDSHYTMERPEIR